MLDFTDQYIRQLWQESGGKFTGPHVEHASMVEAKFLPFMRKLLVEHDRRVEELLNANTREVEARRAAASCGEALAAAVREYCRDRAYKPLSAILPEYRSYACSGDYLAEALLQFDRS